MAESTKAGGYQKDGGAADSGCAGDVMERADEKGCLKMDLPVQLQIAMLEAQLAVVAGASIEDQLRAAMDVTRNHWMCTDEDQQFRAAVGAVMLHYGAGTPQFIRLERETRQLQHLSAAMSGLSVDWEQALGGDDYEPIGLLSLWRSISHREP
jgi:hypothetical protein